MTLTARIPFLIDKRDNRELVRDRIAEILKVESEAQQVLALDASQDPNLWKLRVYSERSEPWQAFKDSDLGRLPIVNVWFETGNFDKAGSDLIKTQRAVSTYHVDIYGFGTSEDTESGHIAADLKASREVERALTLVRNILMAAEYTYLGFPQQSALPQGEKQIVFSRWPASITAFQPGQAERPVERVSAIRFDLEVTHSEFSPQIPTRTLEVISTSLTRAPDGEWVVIQNP